MDQGGLMLQLCMTLVDLARVPSESSLSSSFALHLLSHARRELIAVFSTTFPLIHSHGVC